MNDLLNNRIKIGVHTGSSPGPSDPFSGDFANWRNWLSWPEIRIYQSVSANVRPIDQIIATTFHELAHASHWKNGTRTCFDLSNKCVIEGWARCVQWGLTNVEYASLGQTYNWNTGAQGQSKTNSTSSWNDGYIPFYIDLIDNVNQRAVNSGNTDFAIDAVTGFNIRNVEDAVIGSRTLYQSWEALKAQNIANEGQLWDLFDFYNTL